VDPTRATTTLDLAPAPPTPVKAITRPALLETHVGAVVGAAAAALGAALWVEAPIVGLFHQV